MQEMLKSIFRQREEMGGLKNCVAAYYGIKPEEVPLDEDTMSSRAGLEKQSSAVHEYVVSRVDQLFNFGVVQLTELRAEEGNIDIASVQLGVISTDEKEPARPVTKKLFAEILAKGKDHPGAKSLMRLACLDYLVKTLDRHPNNVFYDPVSHQFSGIDNAASFGLSYKSERVDKSGEKVVTQGPLDNFASVALESISKDEEWFVDDEALESMKEVYNNIVQYLRVREDFKHGKMPLEAFFGEADPAIQDSLRADGKEIKYISQLFRQMFRNEKIAAKEAIEFAQRLREVIVDRRPPQKKMLPHLLCIEEKIHLFSDVADE